MTIAYYDKWFRPRKKPLGPYTPEEAGRRHRGAQPYIAVIEQGDRRIIVDVAGEWTSVHFLDERLRYRESYDFKRKGAAASLNMVKFIEYQGDSDEVSHSFLHGVKEGGLVVTVFTSHDQSDEAHWQVDLASLPAPLPDFGDYAPLLRRIEEVRPVFAARVPRPGTAL